MRSCIIFRSFHSVGSGMNLIVYMFFLFIFVTIRYFTISTLVLSWIHSLVQFSMPILPMETF